MSLRRTEIDAVLGPFLKRYSPPNVIRENAEAQQAEAETLRKILMRYAPEHGVKEWAKKVLGVVAERAKHRTWPMPSELGSVAKEHRAPKQSGTSDFALDPVKINAERIARGEAIGDSWIYGKLAHRLLESGLVTEDHLAPYRSGLFFAECDVYGKDVALRREAARKGEHHTFSKQIPPEAAE